MAGDVRRFQDALKRGADYAWNERWDRAVEEYSIALEQFPEDVSTRTCLAMASFRAGQLPFALDLYQGLWKEQSSNLALLQRVAELQHATGDLESASTSYRVLAEIFGRRRSPKEAFKAWQKVAELKPTDPQVWNSLLDSAIQTGAVAGVLPGYLKLARELALEGRFQEAIQVAERTSTLDPNNPTVMELLAAIRRALEYSWRASSVGDELPLDILPQLIPPLWPTQQTSEPAPSRPARPAADRDQLERRPDSEEPPAPSMETAAGTTRQATGARQDMAPAVRSAQPVEAVAAESHPQEDLEPEPRVALEPPEAKPEPSAPELVVPSEDLAVQPLIGEGEAADRVEEPATPETQPPSVVDSETMAPVEPLGVTAAELADAAGGALVGDDSSLETALEQLVAPMATVTEETEEPERTDVQLPDRTEKAPPREAAPARERPPTPREMDEEAIDWRTLALQAQEARRSVKLIEAAALYQQALIRGAPGAHLHLELAQTYEQLGEIDQAISSYGRALQWAPDLPPALAGLARAQLAIGQLDAAEETASLALEASSPSDQGVDVSTLDLLLEVLRERAANGELDRVAEKLTWLRSRSPLDSLGAVVSASLAETCTDLLGQCAGEHLEELALLPSEDRANILSALSRAEDQLRQGKLRSAADEMYRLLASRDDFLPAQSLLGRILALQRRADEARERGERLVQLYDLRETPRHALEVLWWMVAYRIANEEARTRLVELLRAENRGREADMVELGWQELEEPLLPEPILPDPSSESDTEMELLPFELRVQVSEGVAEGEPSPNGRGHGITETTVHALENDAIDGIDQEELPPEDRLESVTDGSPVVLGHGSEVATESSIEVGDSDGEDAVGEATDEVLDGGAGEVAALGDGDDTAEAPRSGEASPSSATSDLEEVGELDGALLLVHVEALTDTLEAEIAPQAGSFAEPEPVPEQVVEERDPTPEQSFAEPELAREDSLQEPEPTPEQSFAEPESVPGDSFEEPEPIPGDSSEEPEPVLEQSITEPKPVPEEGVTGEAEVVLSDVEIALSLAEEEFSGGDPARAIAMLRSALEEDGWMADASTKVVFSRMLEILAPPKGD